MKPLSQLPQVDLRLFTDFTWCIVTRQIWFYLNDILKSQGTSQHFTGSELLASEDSYYPKWNYSVLFYTVRVVIKRFVAEISVAFFVNQKWRATVPHERSSEYYSTFVLSTNKVTGSLLRREIKVAYNNSVYLSRWPCTITSELQELRFDRYW